MAAQHAFPCIPVKHGRRRPCFFQPDLHALRRTVENANPRLKRFRRIGTRYDKLGGTFLGFVLLASSIDWILSGV